MDEFEFINRIASFAGRGVESIGDDGALFGSKYIVAKDIMAEGVHFLESAPIDLVIHKLFTSNVSDIAAMGGKPKFVLLGISAPKGTCLEKIADGVEKAADFYGVKVIGGDTTESKKGLFLSLTIIGEKGKNLLLRSGARAGDILYLSRPVGLSLAALENELYNKKHPLQDLYHYKITAQKDVGIFLGSCVEVTSAADISDGLGRDCSNIASASGVKLVIFKDKLKFPCLSFLGDKDWQYALSSGEEFALVFTVKKDFTKKFEKDFYDLFKCRPFEIGVAENGRGCFLKDGKIFKDVSEFGYKHF